MKTIYLLNILSDFLNLLFPLVLKEKTVTLT